METKLDIVAILKDKPQGTKLYSSACGKCNLEEVDDNSFKISFYSSKFGFMNGGEGYFDKFGKSYDDGECVIFPSKEMRDWSKFSWKKGDVLVCTDGKAEVIFERFEDDNYTSFVGKHYLESYGKDGDLLDYEQEHIGNTANYTKESDETIQCYINTIEERLGGKLNRETLEVEKVHLEFKDGDIVVTDAVPSMCYAKCIFILKWDLNTDESHANSYIFYNVNNNYIRFNVLDTAIKDRNIRLATDSEKQQLFNALTKEGKAWDAEKKMIVDLKPRVELKPFDKVLVRDNKDQKWKASFFGYKDENQFMCENGYAWFHCIPYAGNEHLLGTTKDVEG